jgi:hypothetical protein
MLVMPVSTRSVAGVELALREWGPPGGVRILFWFWHALGSMTSGDHAAELAQPLVARGAG